MSILLALKVQPGEKIKRGSAHYWSVIRELTSQHPQARLHLQDILFHCDSSVEPATIRKFLDQLVAARFAIGPMYEPGSPSYWFILQRPTTLPHLSRDGRIVPNGQEQMWNAIRALKVFDAPELAIAASTEECQVKLTTALAYLKRLNDAGYLKIEREGKAGKLGRTVYRLKPAMNTGPLAPKILRTKLVYDPNKNAVMGETIAEEDQ